MVPDRYRGAAPLLLAGRWRPCRPIVLEAGLPERKADLASDRWARAAHEVMKPTRCPRRRVRSSSVARLTITGTSEGVGMIRPNMATMLGAFAIDAVIARHRTTAEGRTLADAEIEASRGFAQAIVPDDAGATPAMSDAIQAHSPVEIREARRRRVCCWMRNASGRGGHHRTCAGGSLPETQ